METRFLEVRANGRTLTGAPMNYGDEARLRRGRREKFSPGAFGAVQDLDVRLNIQHDRQRQIARTGGGGLQLLDSPERLQIRADLPNIRDADDALVMVENRMLRGLSVEFDPIEERAEGNLRIIDKADLAAIGLVDLPAYEQSSVEIRQEGEGLAGRFLYDEDMILSDTGRRRKQSVKPGAFTFALEAPDREINLVLGSPERPLASKMTGTLKLRDTPGALLFNVPRLPRTSYATDFLALLAGRAILPGIVPFFLIPPLPNAEGEEEEAGNPGVFRHLVFLALLTSLSVMFRPPRGNPGEVQTRAEDLPDWATEEPDLDLRNWTYEEGGLVLPSPKRKRLWL